MATAAASSKIAYGNFAASSMMPPPAVPSSSIVGGGSRPTSRNGNMWSEMLQQENGGGGGGRRSKMVTPIYQSTPGASSSMSISPAPTPRGDQTPLVDEWMR